MSLLHTATEVVKRIEKLPEEMRLKVLALAKEELEFKMGNPDAVTKETRGRKPEDQPSTETTPSEPAVEAQVTMPMQ